MLSKRLTYTKCPSQEVTYSKVTDRKPIFAKNKLKVELYEMKQSRLLDHIGSLRFIAYRIRRCVTVFSMDYQVFHLRMPNAFLFSADEGLELSSGLVVLTMAIVRW